MLGQQRILGSMLASPSATAAYLMHSPWWDNDSEDYIRNSIVAGAGKGSGLVASGYPTTVFEWAWVSVNLLRYDIETGDRLKEIGNHIEHHIKSYGQTGFVLEACPDADDTAKTLTALALQGTQHSPEKLLAQFE
ncbi:hypothetical protein ETB97_009117 [Aspergillus alliaceus]|uniref:Uncharacterized protein n=1 Tax=Petromyces alliaceus TaxID=209559 RepID=A0A8H6E142_PETAA|nr:hypothetical protein ETB97_009117 [Aspergillus burnettii]